MEDDNTPVNKSTIKREELKKLAAPFMSSVQSFFDKADSENREFRVMKPYGSFKKTHERMRNLLEGEATPLIFISKFREIYGNMAYERGEIHNRGANILGENWDMISHLNNIHAKAVTMINNINTIKKIHLDPAPPQHRFKFGKDKDSLDGGRIMN